MYFYDPDGEDYVDESIEFDETPKGFLECMNFDGWKLMEKK